jgi:hypothetical protein
MRYSGRYIPEGRRCRHWIDPRVLTLSLADTLSYLRSRGWKELPTDREHHLVFEEPTQEDKSREPYCAFAPDSEEYDIYGQMMFELITAVAEYEQRWATEIIDDIVGASARNGAAAPNLAKPEPSPEAPTA